MKTIRIFPVVVLLLTALVYISGCSEAEDEPGSCSVTRSDSNTYCLEYSGDFDKSTAKMNCGVLAGNSEVESAIYGSGGCSATKADFVGNCKYTSMGYDYNIFYYSNFTAEDAEADCNSIFTLDDGPLWIPAK